MRTIFVDAYNVIGAWPDLRELKEHTLQGAREKLIDTLQNYAAYSGCKIFIVFDAHMTNEKLYKKERIGNVTVVYTKSNETADSYIERCVSNIGRKTDVCVVTSDLLEQQLAFQRGATRMSSIEFYFEVSKVNQKIKSKTEKIQRDKRYTLEDALEKETLEKLEKIRRHK